MTYIFNDDFIKRTIDNELVFLNIDSGEFYSVNEIGKYIIEKLVDGYSEKDIVNAIEADYEINNETDVLKDIKSLVADLIDQKIILANHK